MKIFETPEIEIQKFNIENVISTSNLKEDETERD